MRTLVTDQPEFVSQWVAVQSGAVWRSGREQAIGVAAKGQLIAGVVYDQWNRKSIGLHMAALPGHWPTREFIQTAFRYPFLQLGASKLLAQVGEGNSPARRLVEHLGFVLEATLKAAHPMGDLLIYSMTRDQCRWLSTDKKELLCRHQMHQLQLTL